MRRGACLIGLALSAVIAACDSFAISFPSALLAAEKEEEEVANQRHLDYSRVLFSSSPPPPRPTRTSTMENFSSQ